MRVRAAAKRPQPCVALVVCSWDCSIKFLSFLISDIIVFVSCHSGFRSDLAWQAAANVASNSGTENFPCLDKKAWLSKAEHASKNQDTVSLSSATVSALND